MTFVYPRLKEFIDYQVCGNAGSFMTVMLIVIITYRYTFNRCLDVASAGIIISTRRINIQSGERLLKKFLRIREMYDFACLTDLDPLPALLKLQLTSEIPCGYWIEDPCGFISNYDRFSSRTPAWRGILQVLYSSSLATADFMAHLYFGSSGDGYNLSPEFKQGGGPNAFGAIKGWPWCQKVHSETATSLIVRMGSLRSSLPFILGLYQNPPHGSVEDSFPPGSYMSTLVIRFKDFRFSVDLYRNYYSEPDSDFE